MAVDVRGFNLGIDVSPITKLMDSMGQERKLEQQQGDIAALLGRARAGDSEALNQLAVQNLNLGNFAQGQVTANQKAQARQESEIIANMIDMPVEQRAQYASDLYEKGLMDQEDFDAAVDLLGRDEATQNAMLTNMVIGLGDSEFLKSRGIGQTKSGKPYKGVKGELTFVDEKGNYFTSTSYLNENTQTTTPVLSAIDGSGAEPSGKLRPVDSRGQTVADSVTLAVEKAEKEALAKGGAEAQTAAAVEQAKQLGRDAAKTSQSYSESAGLLADANSIYNRAISAIDSGAVSGPIAQYMPTFNAETIELQNAIRSAALNTLKGVTLGAISATELNLVLNEDIPEGMAPQKLKAYLIKKREANKKVTKELRKAATFLSKPGNTVAMWNDKQEGSKETIDSMVKDRSAEQAPVSENETREQKVKRLRAKYGASQ